MSAILLCQILPKPCRSSPVLLISYQEPRSMLEAGQNGMQPLHRDSADPQGCTSSSPAKLTKNKIEPHNNAVNFFLTCSMLLHTWRPEACGVFHDTWWEVSSPHDRFVSEIRWQLSIVSVELSSNSWNKICHNVSDIVSTTKMIYHKNTV